jgi:hypothetical protein
MRALLLLLGLFLLSVDPLAGQAPPLPPDTTADSALVLQSTRGPAPKAFVHKLRARLISNDGRVLIARDLGSAAVAWLVDTAKVGTDSSTFTLSFTTEGEKYSLVIRDWKGRCLAPTGRESSIPLDFGACDRESLLVYPAPSQKTASGETGFWVLTKLGFVGPTAVSPLLVPRSSAKVWFTVKPALQ